MSCQYHIYKEKKENIVWDPSLLYYGYRPQPKELVELV